MKIVNNVLRLSAAFGLVAVFLLLSACKGRTADNVEPTGETIEVEVNVDSSTTPDVSMDTAGIVN